MRVFHTFGNPLRAVFSKIKIFPATAKFSSLYAGACKVPPRVLAVWAKTLKGGGAIIMIIMMMLMMMMMMMMITKSPGKDKVTNFWLKHLVSIHEDMSNIIENPEETPEWLTEGLTFLLPKTKETTNPKNYRPITCLPTMYKILTSIIAEGTYTFLTEHQLLPTVQNGCKKGS